MQEDLLFAESYTGYNEIKSYWKKKEEKVKKIQIWA